MTQQSSDSRASSWRLLRHFVARHDGGVQVSRTFLGGLALIASMLTMTGCSYLPSFGGPNYETIGSLQRAPVDLSGSANRSLNAEQARRLAMQHYEAFLGESTSNQLVPEAMRRLADLHAETERDQLIESDISTSSRAAELYKELLARFPAHERRDDSLYQLARTHEDRGEIDPAHEILTGFSGKHSGSRQYDEVQFRRGEYLFVRKQYADAQQAYSAVINTGEQSRYFDHALYKLGWSQFKLSNHPEALHAFVRLLDRSVTSGEERSRAEQERYDDTLRAVALSFASMGDAAEIPRYFQAQGKREYENLIYKRLAALHLNKQRYSDAANTLRAFSDSHPRHAEAPLFLSQVIDVFKTAGFQSRVLSEKEHFITRFEPASDFWTANSHTDQTAVLEQVHRHLTDVCQHYHVSAQKNKKPKTYRAARDWYRLYLTAFKETREAPLMSFLLAELMSNQKDYESATRQYQITAYDFGSHEKSSEAAYASVLAYDAHEKTLANVAKNKWHRDGINNALRFTQAFPEHTHTTSVRLRSAQQLFALNEYRAAIAAAKPLLTDITPKQTAQQAWVVSAHAHFDLQDYLQAEHAYQRGLTLMPSNDARRGPVMKKLAASVYKQGELAKQAQQFAEATQHFLRVANFTTDAELIAISRYDAANLMLQQSQWQQAIQTLTQWQKRFPKHKLAASIPEKLIVAYKKSGQSQQAATELIALAQGANSERNRALLWEATQIWISRNTNKKAIDGLKQYINRFPAPFATAMEARAELIRLYASAKDWPRESYWHTKMVSAHAFAGKQKSDRSRYLAATSRMALTRPILDEYRNIPLRHPLKASLKKKNRALTRAVTSLEQASAYQIASVTTEASYQLAELYLQLSKALMNAPVPSNLSTEEKAQYTLLLEEQAYPFEEKAIDIHTQNLSRTQTGIYDNWVQRSQLRLAELSPARYAKAEAGEQAVAYPN